MAEIGRLGNLSFREKEVTFESRIPGVSLEVSIRAAQAVEKAMFEIQRGALIRSRVDTGQMRSGWHVDRISTYEGEVYNEVFHTIFNEYGTRYMSAQPMLIPSVEATMPGFYAALRQLFPNR